MSIDQKVERSTSHGPHFSSPIRRLSSGNVTIRPVNSATSVAIGPRCVTTVHGDVLCSYMVQACIGQNDFKPMLSRSSNEGETWTEQGFIWPHLIDRYSIFGSISRDDSGRLYFYGTRTPIDCPGESNWCEASQGLKQNELIWASSLDNGFHWSEPRVIPMPTVGSAEAPGPMCVTSDGVWHVCYSPYNSFDFDLKVPRNQVAVLSSDNEGKTWVAKAMMQFADEYATAAEAWIVELADGRLLGTCWNLNQLDGTDFPNAYAVSEDQGRTWSPTRSTGVHGQTTALTSLPAGGALFIYNQRHGQRPGIHVAKITPTAEDFGLSYDTLVWEPKSVPNLTSTNHSSWTGFKFGEPAATVLPNGEVLLVLWKYENDAGAIEFLKLKVS